MPKKLDMSLPLTVQESPARDGEAQLLTEVLVGHSLWSSILKSKYCPLRNSAPSGGTTERKP